MVAITEKHRDAITRLFDRMVDGLVLSENMSKALFIQLFWNQKQIETVEAAEPLVNPYNKSWESSRMGVTKVEVNEDIPEPFTMAMKPTVSIGGLSPQVGTGMRWDAPQESVDALNNVLKKLAVKMRVRENIRTLESIFSRSKSHEAMRYLFPGYQTMLHTAGMGEIARQIEEIRRVPRLPELSIGERKVVKYMIEWFAVQQLLGTVYGGQKKEASEHPVGEFVAIHLTGYKGTGDHGEPEYL